VNDVALARRAIAMLDLTELGDECTPEAIERLCARATGPAGTVAAVCVWPAFVAQASGLLAGTGVSIATVVNFPEGGDDVSRALHETASALAAGADEIDVVLPYRSFQRGDEHSAARLLDAVRGAVGADQVMKVILETGELPDQEAIAAAARFAIAHGADFIKTSTGKTIVSATPEAVRTMLEVIRASGRPVGIKPSGGIRTLADVRLYLDLTDRIMGPRWATPRTFRFGASGLLDALVAVVDGHPTVAPEGRRSSY
jgi:deoxyribose-phosphate aldolase